MKTLLLLIALSSLVGACKRKEEAKPQQAAPRSASRSGRGSERVCACATTVPDVAKQCELAREQPDAVRLALEFATSPESKPDVVQQSYASVRKTAKDCIEQTAKLPALGCQ